MQRYFIEVAYRGQNYAGFQIQQNANTIQAEIQNAFFIATKNKIELTGSSRTDAGVHAYQNYFHVDTDWKAKNFEKLLYSLNAILPTDISINSLKEVKKEAHCRFDALSRSYKYVVYQKKDPFAFEQAYYYPYPLDIVLLNAAADIIKQATYFKAFSKKHTQVFTFNCEIIDSKWEQVGEHLLYKVSANRFLRGMVRALVATMLQVGRKKISLDQFKQIIESADNSKADFSAPGHGLYLAEVAYPNHIFIGKS
jgi:tRNA pseudouridine38-40 synthase